MKSGPPLVHAIHAALAHERRVNLHRHPIRITFADGVVTLEGEVETIAAKKLALRLAGGVDGVRGVADRLHVAAGERRGDGAIRDSICAFLLQSPEFRPCTIRAWSKEHLETLRHAEYAGGDIDIAVDDGIVTFEGQVPSLTHKRVAGVLAWWTAGCRDVINALDVAPAEEDNDPEVTDALRLVLEMDPLVQADHITVACRNYVVTLRGYARTAQERLRAELDAWAVFAVDNVVNEIEVRA